MQYENSGSPLSCFTFGIDVQVAIFITIWHDIYRNNFWQTELLSQSVPPSPPPSPPLLLPPPPTTTPPPMPTYRWLDQQKLDYNTIIFIQQKHSEMPSAQWGLFCSGLDVHAWSLVCREYCAGLREDYTLAKSNGRFFQTQKLTWCLHPICTICGKFIKCMLVVISYEKYIDFWHQPWTSSLNS